MTISCVCTLIEFMAPTHAVWSGLSTVSRTDFIRYLEYISDHSVILGDRIKHYVNRTIRECIISYLDYESKRQETETIRLAITKKALAERIGVQRTSLSRELAKMRDERLIEFDSDKIRILYTHDA